jgi:hypothetical protein
VAGYVNNCLVPTSARTNQNGVAIINWKSNTPNLHFSFTIRPPDQLRRYDDGSAAKLITEPEKNIFYLNSAVSKRSFSELKCVIPFKAELKVKLINPFAVSDKEPKLEFPNVYADAGSYNNLLFFGESHNDSMHEFMIHSDPRQHFAIRCVFSNGKSFVFPTVHGIMGDGFTPLETTITLQKGTPLRLRLFDENGNSLNWKEDCYIASISEIENHSTEEEEWFHHYDFNDSLRKAERAGLPGTKELVCYLPQGKFQVKAELKEVITELQDAITTQQYYISSSDPTQALQKTIKDNQRIITIPNAPDNKEIILDFHIDNPNVKTKTNK